MDINSLTEQIIGTAIDVHRHLGPGVLENAYKKCMCRELDLRGIRYQSELLLPVNYKGLDVDCGYRIDLLVENRVVVELEAFEKIIPVHEAQLLTYLRRGGWQV